MSDPFVLRHNRARREQASQHLANAKAKGYGARAASRKEAYDSIRSSEESGMAGVVTLEQADATFINLNIHADDTLGAAFAEFTDLKFGEIAVYKTRREFSIRVNVGHLAGGPPSVMFSTYQTAAQVTPFQYFSEEFMVPNLVNANFDLSVFKEREAALERVARDMALYRQRYILNTLMGQPLQQNLSTSFAAYISSTPFAGKNPYVLDPSVVSGSVPTTNVADYNSEGGLTRTIFMKSRTWANQMDRELVRFFIPQAGAPWEAYWGMASIVAYTGGQGNQDVRKAISPDRWEETINTSFRKKGAYMRWFDDSPIYVQPTNVLPAGYGIFSTDLPAVLGWDQYSESISDEESIRSNRHMNRRTEARSVALAQPEPLLRNSYAVKFA